MIESAIESREAWLEKACGGDWHCFDAIVIEDRKDD